MTKVGRKFYVELDFVVDPDFCVRDSDRVRHELSARLDALPHDLWLTVEFTADASWGEWVRGVPRGAGGSAALGLLRHEPGGGGQIITDEAQASDAFGGR